MTLGLTPRQADLFSSTAAYCEGRVAPDSIYGILHRECFSLFPDEILIKLGLDRDINVGFGRRVETLDATHAERLKGIKELRQKMDNSTAGTQKRIGALERADYLAGDKTLREIIDNRPEEYGYGIGAL